MFVLVHLKAYQLKPQNMVDFWTILIAIVIFLSITFLYWKLTRGYVEKVHGKKMFNQWGSKTYYWHTALLVSGGLTVIVIFLLKWANVLAF